jgi:DNA-binding XRE family transcriptional regulator
MYLLTTNPDQMYGNPPIMTIMSLNIFLCFPSLPVMAYLKNPVLLKKIADRIKALRDVQGITQEVFYNDTGIHLGRIELGKKNFSISTMEAICKYFNLSIEEFFKEVR